MKPDTWILLHIGGIVKYVLPFLFTLILFMGTGRTPDKVPDIFYSSIITIDGIFLGFSVLLFSFSPRWGELSKNPNEVVKVFGSKIVAIVTWFSLVMPFVFSIILALSPLLNQARTSIVDLTFSGISALLMCLGMMNLIWTIAELYLKS